MMIIISLLFLLKKRPSDNKNTSGFFFQGKGKTPDARQKGKNARQRPYLGKIFCECCFTSFYMCNPHYTLLYYQLNRYLVTLYQVIWTFTDPENDGFWKIYLDKEKMLVTSSFSSYYNVFYSTLTKFHFCHLQMLSIWTYQNFCHLVWRYEALK